MLSLEYLEEMLSNEEGCTGHPGLPLEKYATDRNVQKYPTETEFQEHLSGAPKKKNHKFDPIKYLVAKVEINKNAMFENVPFKA